ncbi:SDR family NAD(P)-dependent oxidoreductase, partial [Nocardia farcinica]
MSGHGSMRGRGAVVVGATSGIGRAVAEALAAEGAGVVVNGRDSAAVDAAV